MRKKILLRALMISCAFFLCTFAKAEPEKDKEQIPNVDKEITTTKAEVPDGTTPEVAQSDNDKLISQLSKVISELPKISGYIQTGYNWGDKNGDNKSSFQMKRMRLFIDKKLSERFDIKVQFECFSGSRDGSVYKKKVITVMDAFVNAHINKNLHFRAGQYYLPLGFENYDISPATLETVDFSNICYRIVCRNAVNSPDLIDYGRDIGVMAYGDLFENQDKGFSYLSYNLSLTNGYIPTLDDENKTKDLVGRLTLRPIKDIRIMGSYNWGEYKGTSKEGTPSNYLQTNRYVVGAWYQSPIGLNIRTEYGRVRSSEANVKEEGLYVLASYNIGKIMPVARWDMYRDKINETSLNNKDNLLLGCTYEVSKNFKLQANYIHSIYTDKAKDYTLNGKTGSGNSLQIMCIAKF
ncbi:porin [Dysgonomonas sp. BGC7]|uniref:porin n=1 Tax=Dysgonomonas sp. BGC7 TaxID=1658008 RepID=UPI000682A71B|nr:porin [Dysgonomonas sp. BGC7]MBD8388981.1 porin [Dysgonomonas sp. BGC7]